MKQTQRWISLVLCVALVLGMIPVTAFAEQDVLPEDIILDAVAGETSETGVTEPVPEVIESAELLSSTETIASGYCGGEGDGTNLTWTLDSAGTLTISGVGAMNDFSFSNEPWDSNKSAIRRIIIGDGVTSISCSFGYCESLTSINIPASVTSFSGAWFDRCSKLKTVHITDLSVWCNIDFEYGASNPLFNGASLYLNGMLVNKLTIPVGITSIGNYAFDSCNSLTDVVIPDGVTSIGDCAFRSCDNLTSVVIPDGVTSIGGSVFWGCNRLAKIVIPDSVTSIGDRAFYGCHSLTSIRIPSGITSIEDLTFGDCYQLTSVSIPNGVTRIGSSAFSGCSDLSNIVIPNTVTSIDSAAFSDCSSLTNIVIPDGVTSLDDNVFEDCGSLTKVTIPNSVKRIGAWAFSGCESLTNVDIPNDVISIGRGAFYDCINLVNIVIPADVANLDGCTFSGCSSLMSIVIPDGVEMIGDYAFWGCENLTFVVIPSDVSSIDSNAFDGCSNLTSVYFKGNAPEVRNASTSNRSFQENILLLYIPSTAGWTDSEAYDAEAGTWNGYKLAVWNEDDNPDNDDNPDDDNPDNIVTSASGHCGGEEDGTNLNWEFNGSTGTLTISGSGPMEDYSWRDAPWKEYGPFIKTIIIGQGVTTIGDLAFTDCEWEGSVTIPSSVIDIGFGAFPGQPRNMNDYMEQTEFFFLGDAPSVVSNNAVWPSFGYGSQKDVVLYYTPDTSGWTDSSAYDATRGTWNGYELAAWENSTDDGSLQVISQYPIHQGELDGDDLRISMTFNREVESVQTGFFDGNFAIRRQIETADGWEFETVYELENVENDVVIDGKTVTIDVSNANWIANETYYVTMDFGVITFKDTDERIGFGGTQWVFKTRNIYSGNYEGAYGSEFAFKDSYFTGSNSNQYNHNLAIASCNLAISAYNALDAEEQNYSEAAAAKNVRDMLVQLGFNAEDIDTHTYEGKPTQTSIAAAIANKKFTADGEDWTLLTIAVRGGGYEAEWGGNFNVGESGYHSGFKSAANIVESYVKEYVNTHPLDGNVAIWITGYSRAAATANLLAASLNDDTSYIGLDVDPCDIYAYTFETPMGVNTKAANVKTYDNIFNLVNSIDAVTKVAPSEWCFGRYGIDRYFPDMRTNSDYAAYADSVAEYYEEFSGKSLPDDFTLYKLEGDGEFLVYMTTDITSSTRHQGIFLDNFINNEFCGDLFATRQEYYAELQNVAISFAATMLGGAEINKSALTKELLNDIADIVLQELIEQFVEKGLVEAVGVANWKVWVAGKAVQLAKKLTGADKRELADDIAELLVESGAVDITVAEASDSIYNLLKSEALLSFAIWHAIDIYNLIQNLDWLAVSHEPQYCLAWMHAVSGQHEEAFKMGRQYRVVSVNCPVDVRVYDSNDELVAAIINNEVQIIDGSTIPAMIDENEQKLVYLPTDEEYRVETTATDDGTMTYSVSECDIATGTATRIVNYYDVEIDLGDTCTGIVENLQKSEAEYELTANGNPLPPSESLEGTEVVYHTVDVTASESGTVVGGGRFAKGNYALVIAVPKENAVFKGWYIGKELVSTESAYRFCVMDDVTLTAQFLATDSSIEIIEVTDESCAIYFESNPAANCMVAIYDVNGRMLTVGQTTLARDAGRVLVDYSDIECPEAYTVKVYILDETYRPRNNAYILDKTIFRAELAETLAGLTYTRNATSVDIFVDAAKIDTECTDSVLRMFNFGLMSGNEKDLFNPTYAVTRAELAQIIYTALNNGVDDGADAYANENLFSDATAADWYAGYANYCAEQNIIPQTATYFNAADPVTTAEAAKMVLCAMGYSSDACGFVGTNWFNNVLSAAEARGLLDGFNYSTNTYIPRQWLAVMFCNAIDNAPM